MTTHHEWPTENPTAETLLSYFAGRGLWCSAASWATLEAEKHNAHRQVLPQMIAAHDTYMLLDVLHQADPGLADEVASQIWEAAQAGDAYGEWLWQWSEERGLDPEAISDDARSTVARTADNEAGK